MNILKTMFYLLLAIPNSTYTSEAEKSELAEQWSSYLSNEIEARRAANERYHVDPPMPVWSKNSCGLLFVTKRPEQP